MCQSVGQNHKTFYGNFIDPLGFFGGKDGFLGMDKQANKAAAAVDTTQKIIESPAEPISNVQNNDPLIKKKATQIKATLLDNDSEDTGTLLY